MRAWPTRASTRGARARDGRHSTADAFRGVGDLPRDDRLGLTSSLASLALRGALSISNTISTQL